MKISRLLILFITLFSLTSCDEEPPTKGIVTVYDREGNTVSGVTVKLSQENIIGVTQTNVVSTLVSDYNGQTEHILELEALMNIEAYSLSGTNTETADTLLYGTSDIRLTMGKTIYKDVEVFPTN